MPDIGASLREARMRAHIDITEAEADTKIRGKYLRALENEEWRLLPGPTFVRSFLRTYGDYLGLDGRLLVEDFKLRYERGEGEPPPIAKGAPRGGDRRRGSPRSPSGAARGRALLVGGLLVLLLAGLFALGRGGDDDDSGTTTGGAAQRQPAAAGVATLRIAPTRSVYACVRAADGKVLVDEVLQPSARGRELRSRRLRVTLGSGYARLVVNGEERTLPRTESTIGLEVTPAGLRRVGADRRPRCS